MENKLIRAIAKSLAGKINFYTHKEGVELQKMELGVEIFVINVSKIIIIYLLAVLLGLLWQTLITHTAFILTRRYSFGLHALNSTVCTIVSCCVFVVIPLFLSNIGITNFGVIIAFSIIIFILYRFAPADTKARPLIGVKLRAQLKRKAVACGVFIMITALLVPDETIKTLLTIGAVFQCISILPLTYQILKRSEKNYELYECA